MQQLRIVIAAPKHEQPVIEAGFCGLGFSTVCHERLGATHNKAENGKRTGLLVTTRAWLDREGAESLVNLERICLAHKCALLVIGARGSERFAVPVEYLPSGFDLLALHEVLRICIKDYSRRHLRLTTRLPGVISRAEGCQICEIVNLSAGGAFVKTGTQLSVNGEVTLHVPLLGMKRELELGSQVVFRVVPSEQNNYQQGVGLRFADADELIAGELQSYLGRLHGHRVEDSCPLMPFNPAQEDTGQHRPRNGSRDRRLTIHG